MRHDMPEEALPLHSISLTFSHHHNIVFRGDVRTLIAAAIGTFLALPLTYFMMNAVLAERPEKEHHLDGKPDPRRRHP